MYIEKVKQFKWQIVAAVALLALLPAFIVFNNWSMANKMPKVKDQPTDTRVSSGVLQLHHWDLEQGTGVYFVPTEDPPIVDIMVQFDAGAARDSALPGISKLTADLLAEGTTTLSGDAIADALSNVGAQYTNDHAEDYVSFRLRCLAEDKKLRETVALFADMLAKPAFQPESIARVKQQMLVTLETEADDPNLVAYQRFLQAIYGKHPYANVLSGTDTGIKQVTLNDIQAFHAKHYVGKNATIIIVGSIHRDLAREISKTLMSALNNGAALDPLPEVNLATTEVKDLVAFPSQQSHIYLGQPGRIAGDPDYFPLEVGNYILGGGQNSALHQEIREQRGLAYSVYSSFRGMNKPGPFFMNLQTKGNQSEEAVGVLKQLLANFMRVGPTEDKLTAAKDYLIGAFPLKFASNRDILYAVSNIALYKLPYNFFDTYADGISKVTSADIVTAFGKRVHPDQMALVVVGGKVI